MNHVCGTHDNSEIKKRKQRKLLRLVRRPQLSRCVAAYQLPLMTNLLSTALTPLILFAIVVARSRAAALGAGP